MKTFIVYDSTGFVWDRQQRVVKIKDKKEKKRAFYKRRKRRQEPDREKIEASEPSS